MYVPKLLNSPALEGGTDGDGLPPTFDLAARRETDLVPWLKGYPWTALQGKVAKLLE